MSKQSAIMKQTVSQLPDTSTGKYSDVLEAVKERISSARLEASVAVNTRLIALYWQIGKDIISRIEACDASIRPGPGMWVSRPIFPW